MEVASEPELDVVVTTTRFDTARGNVPAVVSVVTGEEAKARPATNVDDLLRSQATLDGQRYQGMGNAYPHILSVRGIRGADRFLVLLDGQPINNALNGYPNLNLLPLDRIQRIEFVRGPFSALYGSRAMAGVINVITERGGRDPGLRLQSGIGPFGAHLLGGSAAGEWGPAEITVSYDRRQTDNYVGSSAEPNVDYRHDRVHSRVDLFRKRAVSMTLTGGLYRSGMGFDQYVDLRSTQGLGFWLRNEGRSSMNDQWGQAVLSWKAAPSVDLRATGSVLHHEQGFHTHPVLLEGTYPAGYLPAPEMVNSDGTSYRGELLARWFAADWMALVAGADLVREKGTWHTADLASGVLKTGMEGAATTSAGFAQAEGTFLQQRLRIIAGTRVDHHSTFGTALSPKIGASAALGPQTTIRGSFGRAFRSPSLTELYQPAWQRVPPYKTVGNEALRPEILYAADLGIDQRLGQRVTARVTGFYNDGRDLIGMRVQPDNLEHYLNHGRIQTAGVEVESAIIANQYLRFQPSYAFTYSRNRDTDKPLDYVPAHLGGMTVLGRLPVGKTRFEAAIDVRVVGRREFAQTRDPTSRGSLSPYALANARLQWGWPSATFFADAYNLFDARYHENEGILAPRFLFLAGVRLENRWPWP